MMVPLFKYPEKPAKDYFALQRRVLKILGISFSQDVSYLYRIYSVLWLSSIMIFFSLVEFYEIYVYRDNLDVLVNNLSYLGTDLLVFYPRWTTLGVLGIAKIAVLLYYRLDIGKLLDNMETGLFSVDTSIGSGMLEDKLIKRCILLSNRQTCLYYLCVLMVVGFGALGTILKRIVYNDSNNWEMPFMTFSWFDTNSSPTYELIWFYQSWWRTFYAMIVSSIDSLIAGILAHISTKCKILQNSIKNAVADADIISSSHAANPRRILAKKTKELVDYHMAIIDLSDRFEDFFNLLILTIFVSTLFILCFVMYHASLFDLLTIRAAQDFSYVALLALQVFLYCYWGNEVGLESEKVAVACWQADFLEADVQFQKSLNLMIRRSQKPIVLTAGKFTSLSLATYVWIIRLSYSYYMVLRNYHTT